MERGNAKNANLHVTITRNICIPLLILLHQSSTNHSVVSPGTGRKNLLEMFWAHSESTQVQNGHIRLYFSHLYSIHTHTTTGNHQTDANKIHIYKVKHLCTECATDTDPHWGCKDLLRLHRHVRRCSNLDLRVSRRRCPILVCSINEQTMPRTMPN